jgi:hypothetical protein
MSEKRLRKHLDLEVLKDEYEKGWSVAELARRERIDYSNLRNALCKIYGTDRIRHFKGRACYNAVASELNVGKTSRRYLKKANLKKMRAVFLILSTRETYATIGEKVQLAFFRYRLEVLPTFSSDATAL